MGHRVYRRTAKNVVAEGVNGAVPIRLRRRLAEGIDRVGFLECRARVAGPRVRELCHGQDVVRVDTAAAGRGDAVDVLRFLKRAAGQVRLHGQLVVVPIVGIFRGFVGIGARIEGAKRFHRPKCAPQPIVIGFHNDAARVGDLLLPPGVTAQRGDSDSHGRRSAAGQP